MPEQKPRQIAVNILRRHSENLRFLDKIVEHELAAASLTPADRGLVLELVNGVTRQQAILDWLIARRTREKKPKGVVQILLRLGLYQIYWLDRVPDHAAVNETVDLVRSLAGEGVTGFVNAVLRASIRDKEATLLQVEELKNTQPALGYSHPEWLCERWRAHWNTDKLRQLLDWNNRPARIYARLNSLKASQNEVLQAWQKEGVSFEARSFDWVENGLVYALESPLSLARLPSFQAGMYYIQDPSTLLAVHELNPQPGESVLDFCAAPGGKTTYIAQRMKNQGYIMAQDLDIHRRLAIRENCDRLGVKIVNISRATTAINFELSKPFDKVLLDVPCSNTGVMRRRVDLRWRIHAEDLANLQAAQHDIILRACRQVKKGGLMVYSTCSLEPEENHDLIQAFLKEYPRFKLENERELLPFLDEVDGAYVARLRLEGETPKPQV